MSDKVLDNIATYAFLAFCLMCILISAILAKIMGWAP